MMRPFPTLPLLATALLACPAFADVPDAAGSFAWRDDLEGSRKAARVEGKPLLIVFR
jgi:hypothetical protein